MDRYQFRLDAADPRQRALMAELDAAPTGRRNAMIVDKLLRGSREPPPVITLDDIRRALRETLIEGGGWYPASPAARRPDIGADIPDDLFDVNNLF